MFKITVVNKRTHAPTENDFYVGRGSLLGNPFTSKSLGETKAKFEVKSREEAISKYKEYLDGEVENNNKPICDKLNEIYTSALKNDINLVCYCKPNDCHGDYIKNIVNSKIINFYMKKGL